MLYAFNPVTEQLRTSRFQFVDLAGSERLKDAHGAYSLQDPSALEGLVTNFSLMMLSQRMREIVEAGRTGKSRKDLVKMSFKTQNEPDLIPLVSESLTGLALTLVCVCLSAAPANTSQSINALGFGCEFSRLSVRPSVAKRSKLCAW
jgi:kinesin family protein 4/21/27